MQLAENAGLKTIVLSAVWKQGASAQGDLPPLRRAVRAAKAQGIDRSSPCTSSAHRRPSTTPPAPPSASTQWRSCGAPSVRTVLVGNEPNLNLFWVPQFDPSGGDAAAAAYEQLLASTYDALKGADPKLTVVGGNLAAARRRRPGSLASDALADRVHRGSRRRVPRERPTTTADGHVLDPRLRRVAEDPAVVPPSAHDSIGIADYDKLVSLLGRAFDGTAQSGSKLPLVYGEYGVETEVPAASAATPAPRSSTTADAQTQAHDYARRSSSPPASRTCGRSTSSTCSTSRGCRASQSGLYYPDGNAPKPSAESREAGPTA